MGVYRVTTMPTPRMTIPAQTVLRIFLDAPAVEHYGLEISKATGMKSGTLYPVLNRLERAGWLESGWEAIDPRVEGRRPRRYYKITANGRAEATAAFKATLRAISPGLALGGTG